MKTPVEPYLDGDGSVIALAAEIIKRGGLVAFPTETVYGLGADAFNPEAVASIYAAKGRPSDNPLIVHISTQKDLERCAANVPGEAVRLMDAFWPGPLTIILQKTPELPLAATGGLNTVALRCPDSRAARRLIEAAGTPIAAPSANPSGRPSPTEAAHVSADLDGKIEMIIDGGACFVGIESTIVDMTGDEARILRPGSITGDMISEVLGYTLAGGNNNGTEQPKAPGMKYAHYAPLAPLTVVAGDFSQVAAYINERCHASGLPKDKIGVLATDETAALYTGATVIPLGSRSEPATVARSLYAALRKFDFLGVSRIYSEAFYDTELGHSVMNRLEKAAGYDIVWL